MGVGVAVGVGVGVGWEALKQNKKQRILIKCHQNNYLWPVYNDILMKSL